MKTHSKQSHKEHYLQFGILIFALTLWFLPTPEGLKVEAWHLFAIFILAILAVMLNAMPIFTSSILALAAAVLSGTLSTEDAYSGFSQGFILLIIVAFVPVVTLFLLCHGFCTRFFLLNSSRLHRHRQWLRRH